MLQIYSAIRDKLFKLFSVWSGMQHSEKSASTLGRLHLTFPLQHLSFSYWWNSVDQPVPQHLIGEAEIATRGATAYRQLIRPRSCHGDSTWAFLPLLPCSRALVFTFLLYPVCPAWLLVLCLDGYLESTIFLICITVERRSPYNKCNTNQQKRTSVDVSSVQASRYVRTWMCLTSWIEARSSKTFVLPNLPNRPWR